MLVSYVNCTLPKESEKKNNPKKDITNKILVEYLFQNFLFTHFGTGSLLCVREFVNHCTYQDIKGIENKGKIKPQHRSMFCQQDHQGMQSGHHSPQLEGWQTADVLHLSNPIHETQVPSEKPKIF